MPILILHCELNRSDVKSFKSRQSVLTREISRGRRPDQISSNGSVFFVQTPERAEEFATRLIVNSGLNIEKDRLAVIDVRQGKVYVWGAFDAELRAKFPFIIEECSV